MKVAILNIGDELLIGQILNSNAQWMSEELTGLGITVSHHFTVGDTFEAIYEGLDFLQKPDAVIISGGLGPTHDDLTMEALSRYFSIPLVYDQYWINQVEAFFKARNRVMTENNKKQGYVLGTATRIDNDCGTACGQHFKGSLHSGHGLDIFVVPGVPHEMKSMMNRYILPVLKNKEPGTQIFKKTLLVTGIGESALATQCHPFVEKILALQAQGAARVSLAFLPSSIQVKLRLLLEVGPNNALSNPEQTFQQWVDELKALCGKNFFAFEPMTLEQLLIQNLVGQGKSLATAESCTGGLITHRLTQVPGASKVLRGGVVAYQSEIKTLELGIDESIFKTHGVVSETVAKAMAQALQKKWNTDYAISTTGYLGSEGGDAFASLGTVWIGVANRTTTVSHQITVDQNRERGKERVAQAALDTLRRLIIDG